MVLLPLRIKVNIVERTSLMPARYVTAITLRCVAPFAFTPATLNDFNHRALRLAPAVAADFVLVVQLEKTTHLLLRQRLNLRLGLDAREQQHADLAIISAADLISPTAP